MKSEEMQELSDKVTAMLGHLKSKDAVTFLSFYIAYVCQLCGHSKEVAINFVASRMASVYDEDAPPPKEKQN